MSANTKKISIFIPVYRESELLEKILESLLSDPYEEKEIFVVIDEPTQKSLEISKRFSVKGVHFKLNGARRGKASALNDVITESKGDILMFLDSDVLLVGRGGGSFLKTISEEMENAEIIDIRKESIRDSFVAKIANYDYLGFNLTNLYFSRKVGRCLAINGAAFAIRRETFEKLGGFRRVICEDLDIAIRSFVNGARFKFVNNVIAYTKVPSSWRGWFNQRKRWSIGAAFWVKENLKVLRKVLRTYPEVVLPLLLFVFPPLPLFLINIFTPDDLFIKTTYMLLLLFSTEISVLIPPVAISSISLPILKGALTVAGSFIGYITVFFIVAKKMHFHFNPLEFLVFYFVMAPLWFLLIVVSLFRVYIKPEKVHVDWKV